MLFNLSGRFSGRRCDDCLQPLFPGTLHIYRTSLNEQVGSAVNANVKDTLVEIKAEDYARIEIKPEASVALEADGTYTVEWQGEALNYKEEALSLVLELPFQAPMEGPEKKFPTRYIALTSIQPVWDRSDAASYANFSYVISPALYCRILEWFDLWVICGQVTDCKTKRPLSGVSVTAKDCDVITDDTLGTATTNGHKNVVNWLVFRF